MPRALLLVACVALSGCAREGFYHDRNLDYVDAEIGTSLQLPTPVSRNPVSSVDGGLQVPSIENQAASGQSAQPGQPTMVSAPPSLVSGSLFEPAMVETRELGENRWLVVDAPDAVVWPRLEAFATSSNLMIDSLDRQQGRLVTDALTLRVKPGVRDGSTEIRCDPEQGASGSCLDSVSDYLATRLTSANAVASASLSQRSTASRLSASFERQSGGWRVVVPFEPERVWAELDRYLRQDFTREGERLLVRADSQALEFLIDYKTLSERNRSALSVLLSSDTRQMSLPIRLVLNEHPEGTRLEAINTGDRDFNAEDQRELLERVTAYLR